MSDREQGLTVEDKEFGAGAVGGLADPHVKVLLAAGLEEHRVVAVAELGDLVNHDQVVCSTSERKEELVESWVRSDRLPCGKIPPCCSGIVRGNATQVKTTARHAQRRGEHTLGIQLAVLLAVRQQVYDVLQQVPLGVGDAAGTEYQGALLVDVPVGLERTQGRQVEAILISPQADGWKNNRKTRGRGNQN